MVLLGCPRATWSLAAGARGWTTSGRERRKGGASCRVPRIRFSCSALSTDLVLVSPILRRIDTTAASVLGRRRSSASTFLSKGISEQADGDLQHDAGESPTATQSLTAYGENLNEAAQSQTADELAKASADSSSENARSQTAYESPKRVSETQKLEVADRQTAVESHEAVLEAHKILTVQNRESAGHFEGEGETQKLEVADRQTAVESLETASEAQKTIEVQNRESAGHFEGEGETQKLEVADRQTAVESLETASEAQKTIEVQNRESAGYLEAGEETLRLEVSDRQTAADSLEGVAEERQLEFVQDTQNRSVGGDPDIRKLKAVENQIAAESFDEASRKQEAEVVENETYVKSTKTVTETQKLEVFQSQTAAERPKDQTASGSLEMVEETQELEVVQIQIATGSDEAVGEIKPSYIQAETSRLPMIKNAMPEAIPAQTQSPNISKTVRVKFTLQKSCQFGEQFLLLGAGTTLGQWDTANAIPLEWSDGHVWMAEMELPVEEEIKFKFVRRDLSKKLAWQPGPDRILRTWETANTIVVAGEWDNADDQKITEEGPSAIPAAGEFSEERDDHATGNGIAGPRSLEQAASGVAGGLSGE